MSKIIKYFNEFLLENLKMKIDLPQDILNIADAYFKADKELYIIGGFVRDFVKYGHSKKSHDIDLVTNALPYESKEILKNFKVSDEQGSNFAVIRCYTDTYKEGIEIASFRKDIVKNGRNTKGDDQKVEIGKHITIEDDVKRRDLKCNGLFYNIKTHEIIDLVGGVEDIKNNIFGAIGRASDRFDEDELRKIRLIRFVSRSYGKIDKETSKALKQNNSLKTVSRERIYDEFVNKMLDYAKKHNDLKMMQTYLDLITEYNLWSEMFPKLEITKIDNLNTLNATIIFTMLFKNNDTNNLLNYLIREIKLSSDISNEIVFLIKLQNLNIDNFYELKKLQNRLNIDKNIIFEYFTKSNQYSKLIDKFINFNLTVKGEDLMNKGYKGAEIGKKIKELEIKRFNDFITN